MATHRGTAQDEPQGPTSCHLKKAGVFYPPPQTSSCKLEFLCTREANVLNRTDFALELDLIFEEILYFFDAKILRHFGKIRKHRNA